MSAASDRVLDAAIAVARSAPAKQGQYVSKAGIWWKNIHELRAALDDFGLEWRPSKEST